MTTNLTFFRRCLFTLLGILMGVVPTLAAPLTIRGIVTASDSVPLDNVAVTLLALPDSVYAAGTTTDAQGQFVFNDVDGSRRYLLSANSFGYEPGYAPASAKVRIDLRPITNELAEVIVTGKAPVIKSDAGKFTIIPNELKDLAKDGLHLINLAPMVSVDSKGANIVGKPKCKLYINGKEPLEEYEATVQMLKELPPQYIKKIELITAPGASQDVTFAGGIVNVIIDDPREGMIGSVSGYVNYAGTGIYNDERLNIGTRKGKFSTNTFLRYSHGNTFDKQDDQYFYPLLDKYVLNKTSNYSHYDMIGGSFTAMYNLKDNIEIGASLWLSTVEQVNKITAFTKTKIEGKEEDSYYKNNKKSPFNGPNIGATLYFKMTTDTQGSNLEVRADYVNNYSKTNSTEEFSEEMIPDNFKYRLDTYKVKADYRLRRGKYSISTGYQFYDKSISNKREYNYQLDDFRYHDIINSVYAQANWQCNDAISVTAGVRMEQAHTKIDQLSTSEHFTRNYLHFVPNVSASFTLPKGRWISVDFTPYLSRPWSSDLNTYKYWSSDNSYTVGNPYLKPYISWSGSIYAQIFNGFIVNIRGYYANNVHCTYTLNDADGNAVTSYTNEGNFHNFSVDISYSKTLLGIWRLSGSVSPTYDHRKAIINSQNLGFVNWSFYFGLNNSIVISKRHNFYGSLSYRLRSPLKIMTENSPWQNMLSASLSKVFACGLEAGLSANYLLGETAKSYSTAEFYYNKKSRRTSLYIGLNLTYRFGKKTVKATKDLSNKGNISN